ncbi:sodium:proton antiporter [Halomonas salipaludis]|uniref:Nickel/cobalt efflux system n=2 Tax=Halomonas salipaludis TaxID=2032625 RepID=A0A2A2ERJ6_9GAMM|nr:sodium:proton antiporter [Halomonas salipaludis]PAU75025.1 sodium:proton antiporter [Halomonas salipaludis]
MTGAVWLGGLAGILVVAGLIWLFQGGAQAISLQVVAWQRDLHRALTLAITELSGAPSPAAWVTLLGISFGYGVFHAAGPGHGKAVLTTYLLSQGGALRRALALSCAASLLQALVAITLVAVLVHGLGWLTRQAMGSVAWVEQASFFMVTLLGLWLCWRALRQLRRTPAAASVGAAATRPTGAIANHDHEAHQHHHHEHHHDHCGCGSAHHVDPRQAADWRTALATVVAIGIRPCSGGVLLLGAASLLGQFWVGVSAVLVMAAGTALAVSALALASVMARGWAERRLARQSSGSGVQRMVGWAALAGGLTIVLLGVSLSVAGVSSPSRDPLLTPGAERSGQPQESEAPRQSPFG